MSAFRDNTNEPIQGVLTWYLHQMTHTDQNNWEHSRNYWLRNSLTYIGRSTDNNIVFNPSEYNKSKYTKETELQIFPSKKKCQDCQADTTAGSFCSTTFQFFMIPQPTEHL